ncbi:hypothetical protein FQR65_LT16128 [Abscondita terminalis]|nr:hypothetical protein FQR65_LT16128 [Abscondita terminalis]
MPITESNALLTGVLCTQFSQDYIDDIVAKLRHDDIGQVANEDSTILKFGYLQYEKHGPSQCELIRQSMRQMSRFLLRLQQLHPNCKNLSDFLIPQKFDVIIDATKSLCGLKRSKTEKPELQIPSLGLKIGHALKKCVGIMRGEALRKGMFKENEKYVCLLNLIEMEWHVKISSAALTTLSNKKFNCAQLLPLTEDLLKLSNYLDTEILLGRDKLKRDNCFTNWRNLAVLIISRIILFNKRRSGEASRMTIEQYKTRSVPTDQGTQELWSSLSSMEQYLAKKLTVIDIIGKRGRRVPVILTPEIVAGIDFLLELRLSVGVAVDNPYVFALGSNSMSYLRGHDCIRTICQQANLKHPDYITGTKLRKYVATVCQLLNLNENETDWLARHLGHDIRVHRDFYRLHENTVEATKISRLLIAVENGDIGKYAGKSLNDINITDLPALEEEKDNGGEEEEEEDVLETCGADLDNVNNCASNAIITLQSSSKSNSKTKAKQPFKINIKKEIIPGKSSIMECINKHPVLQSREWRSIKYHVKNIITRNKKLIKK